MAKKIDLSQCMNTMTINEGKSPNITEQESLKRWIEGCDKLQPDSKVKNITNVYRSNVRLHSTVVIKLNSQDQIHYYKIQVLKHKTDDRYWLFRTWGTIPTVHGSDLLQELPRRSCISKYKWLIKSRIKRDFTTLDMGNTSSTLSLNIKGNLESKLPVSVQNLMKLIFNADNICEVMKDYKLDTEKIKPGQLSNKKIRQAYGQLKMILHAISILDDPEKVVIINKASARFYSCIPQLLNNQLPLLNNPKVIEEKFDMLDELSEMNLAGEIMNFRSGEICNVLDIYYDRLKTDIRELGINTEEYKIIERYINNTHSFVHNKYEIDIEKIFVINRAGEAQKYANRTRGIENKMLLWHGTKLTNISSILLKGLRIPRKSSTGHMFGRGIYFADVVSKSANHCKVKSKNLTAVLLLCEVALGNMEEQFEPDNNLVLPKRKHSAFAQGRYGPDCKDCIEISQGVKVPYGKLTEQKLSEKTKLKLLHNEYIVYDPAQIKMKYLIQIKFNNVPRHETI